LASELKGAIHALTMQTLTPDEWEKKTGKIPTVLIMENGFLKGELSVHEFALAKKHAKVRQHLRKIPSISYDKNEHDILETFRKHPHGKIVVLDEDQSILGVIYSDDMLKLLHEQTSKSLRDFAGV
jgi:magnesium transporter